MTSLRTAIAPYRPLVLLLLVGLAIVTTSRGILFLLYSERILATGNWPLLLLQGVRADLIMLGYWLIIPLLLLPMFILANASKGWQLFTRVWVVAVLGLILALELMTPAFIAQYDVRPNHLFIEYLGYPREVLSTLWNGFRGWLLLSIGGVVGGGLVLHRLTRLPAFNTVLSHRAGALWLWPIALVLTVIGIRSTLDHRPANPALFAITADPLVNSLVLSSTYSVQFALYNLRHEDDASRIYGALSDQQLATFIQQLPYFSDTSFDDPELPTLHWQPASRNRVKPLNIVIILEKSLGYGFVERGLTPNLAALRDKGWWFEQMYATGTRSVRGIEAVVAGFPPSPARSTVKLSGSQQGFFTIAETLKQQGYVTEFIYGGEAHFDKFHIPAVIVGADLEPRTLAAITSQIDLTPTLLSLAGISAALPTIGQDLSASKTVPANRALLQFNQTFALLEGDRVTILQPEQQPLSGRYDFATRRFIPEPQHLEQAHRALHYSLIANWLYRNQLYHTGQRKRDYVQISD